MHDSIQALISCYPNFSSCSIQTFDDTKGGNKQLAQIFSIGEDTWEKCEELNQKGAGIFFSVNSMEQGKRNKESVTKINTRICEIDGIDKQDQMKIIETCPLLPSMIIESKNSYHLYWFAVDGTKENRNAVCNGLRNFFDGDPAVIEISRVLRLPGYNHNKDIDDLFMIQICVDYYSGEYYSEEDMLSKYTDTRSLSEIKQQGVIKETVFKKEFGEDYFWERVKNMDTQKVLEIISGDRIVNGDQYTFKRNGGGTQQIFVNGKSTGCWIDKDGKIGSKTGGGPNRTNRVFWYNNISGKELYQRIKDKFPEMIQSKHIEKKEVKEIKDDTFRHITYKEKLQRSYDEIMNTDSTKIIKRGREEWDNLLGGIYGGKIYLIGADTGVGKTTFVNQVVNQIVSTGERVVRYSLEDRMEDIGKEELYYECNRMRRKDGREFYKRTKFVNHEYKDDEFMGYLKKAFEGLSKKNIIELDKTKRVNLDSLIGLMEEESNRGTKIFVIDHLHYFEWDTKQEKTRLDLQIQNAMQEINEIARKHNVAVFLIAHYKQLDLKTKGKPSYNRFKDGASIKQVANVIIQIEREIDEYENDSTFYISKLRGPIKTQSLTCEFNINTFEYSFKKTEEQKNKEENYLRILKK